MSDLDTLKTEKQSVMPFVALPAKIRRPKLAISFSGGLSSAVMTKRLIEAHCDTHDISVVFANTGQEDPATLQFVHDCDTYFGFKTVWLEAVVNPRRNAGIRHKVVSFETASRDGTPFRAYIAKYGIPNIGSPTCTGRLKEDVMVSYWRRVMKWKAGTYETAIGMRADEIDRMDADMYEKRFIYPLIWEGVTKADVHAEAATWPFRLNLNGEHFGNCVWCWKKSLRKLLTVAQQRPEAFDFPAQMEAKFGRHKVTPSTASPDGRRLFFRGHRSAVDIVEMARAGNFEPYDEKSAYYDPELDVGSGCGESCEVGADS